MTEREKEILDILRVNPLISQQELAEKLKITRSSVAVHISNLLKKGKIVGKGYILESNEYISVIGGINIDIGGTPKSKLIDRDSNPGKIEFSYGGVGRNIAENLAKMDEVVELISVVGDDVYGKEVLRYCRDEKISVNHTMVVPNAVTSSYVFILDENHDMQLAISSMDLFEKITVNFIKNKRSIIEKSKVCVLDTNIPQETLEYIAENFDVPIFVDCVSTTKAQKLKNILGEIHTLKANKIEAEVLSGITITDKKSLERAVNFFLEKGVKQVFISLGADGIYLATPKKSFVTPAIKTDVVNATGAGDAFMAGIVYGFRNKLSQEEACTFGVAAASLAISCKETINPNLSIETIKELLTKNGGKKI